MLSRPGPQSSTSRALTWIQCELGKQYLEKKFTLPWESNPGPTPNRGDLATLVASVGLKKDFIVLQVFKNSSKLVMGTGAVLIALGFLIMGQCIIHTGQSCQKYLYDQIVQH